MKRHAPVSVVLLTLAAAAVACLPGRGVPETDSETYRQSDSVAVFVQNDNYLTATVRLFSDGAQVRRISVTGHNADTTYLRRRQLRMPGDVSAVLELVGSRQAYRLRRELLPVDASLIEIRVAELLSTSSMSIF